jgi:hypothetical protein
MAEGGNLLHPRPCLHAGAHRSQRDDDDPAFLPEPGDWLPRN